MSGASLACRVAVIGLRIMSGDNVTSGARRTLRRNLGKLDPAVLDRLTERVTSTTYADLEHLADAGMHSGEMAAAVAMRPDVVSILEPRAGLRRDAPPRFAAVAYALGLAYVHVEQLRERERMQA